MRTAEVQVLGALPIPAHGLDRGLEVSVRRYEDGGVVPIFEGAGNHVDGQAHIDALFFVQRLPVDHSPLKEPESECHERMRTDARVVGFLPSDLLSRALGRGRHVVVPSADELSITRKPEAELADVDPSRPAALPEAVVEVRAIDEDRNALAGTQDVLSCA